MRNGGTGSSLQGLFDAATRILPLAFALSRSPSVAHPHVYTDRAPLLSPPSLRYCAIQRLVLDLSLLFPRILRAGGHLSYNLLGS